MSGGSYNYLENKDLTDESTYTELIRMRDRLVQLTDNNSSNLKCIRDFNTIIVKIIEANELFSKLKNVMHAVEWYDSSDWGWVQLVEEVIKYEKNMI